METGLGLERTWASSPSWASSTQTRLTAAPITPALAGAAAVVAAARAAAQPAAAVTLAAAALALVTAG